MSVQLLLIDNREDQVNFGLAATEAVLEEELCNICIRLLSTHNMSRQTHTLPLKYMCLQKKRDTHIA